MRKSLLLLALLLLLAAVCRAEEAEVFTSGDYKYSLAEDGTAIITKYTGNEKELLIPDKLDGYKVTGIGDDAFYGCRSLTAVMIPDSVVELGVNPFARCSKLREIRISPDQPMFAVLDGVLFNKEDKELICYPMGLKAETYVIPQGIRKIGEGAFDSCSSLTAITISDSVTSIGEYAFIYCDSLTTVTIPDGVTSIGELAFSCCISLTAVTIPDSVTSIGDWVFALCDSLTAVTIPNSVTSIGDSAFSKCSALTAITIPDSVTSIGDEAFYGCRSLTSVTIPDSVMSIGDSAFSWCGSLTEVTIPDSVVELGVTPFVACSKLREIRVSPEQPMFAVLDGVLFNKVEKELICYPAGFNADTYVIPQGIRKIGDAAFYDCDSLTAVTIPNSVTNIGNSAFCHCHSLTAVTIPNSVTNIGDFAFYDCDSLTAVTIPDSVTCLGDSAFSWCDSLTSVIISVVALADILPEIFEDCSRITFTVPRGSELAAYCKKNGLNYTYPDSNDWLLN